jgi:hypothetical protein
MFEEELEKITGDSKFWAERLAPQMEHIVMSTLRSVQTRLVPRKECFELYGFDVMLDEDFKMWLLEVNLSPGCENRVPFIDQMIKRMSSRLIEVAVLGKEEPDGEPLDWIPIANDKSDTRDPRDEAALRSGQALPCVADLSIIGQPIVAPKRRKRRACTTPDKEVLGCTTDKEGLGCTADKEGLGCNEMDCKDRSFGIPKRDGSEASTVDQVQASAAPQRPARTVACSEPHACCGSSEPLHSSLGAGLHDSDDNHYSDSDFDFDSDDN